MYKKVVLLAIGMVLVLMLAGCSGTGKDGNQQTPPTSPDTVSIQGFQFNPSSITITKGDSITWINNDSAAHTVTGTGFDSGSLGRNASFKHTFTDTGTFDYQCSFHPSMKGQVIVK